MEVLGSVETSVVGLSHLFHTSSDRNGALLKKLAAFLGRSCENAHGMSEIILRRNTNVPADVNAVSVLVPNPDRFSEGGEASFALFDPSVTYRSVITPPTLSPISPSVYAMVLPSLCKIRVLHVS